MSKQKALLVDDSKSARFFLRNLLQKNDIEVEMADSGEAALEYLKEHRPDIIFMDHLMPGIDGFQTTQSIKGNPDTSAIPVVMCTSNEGQEYIEQAKSIGASEILPKPPTEDSLLRILNELSKPIAPAATAPAAGLAAEEIQALARSAAQAAVEQALGPMLDELLSARLEGFKQELMQQGEEQAQKTVNEAMILGGDRIQEQVLSLAREESKALAANAAEAVVDQAADRLLQKQAQEMQAAAERGAAQKLEEFRGDWASERQGVLNEANQLLASVSGQATNTAREVARDTARASAQQIAEDAAREIAGDIARDKMAAMGGGNAQAKLYAVGAAVVGVLAALAVYFIK